MENKIIKVAIVSGKKIENAVELSPVKGEPKTVTIDAVENGKYILAEDGSGVAPENITVKRVGDDLWLSVEGEETDKPQLVIRDYYQHPGEIVGMAEDGAYHQYISTDAVLAHDAESLSDGTVAPLALSSDTVDGLAGLEPGSDFSSFYPLLAGLGILGLGLLGAAAATHHNRHSGNHDDNGGDGGNGGGGDGGNGGKGGDTTVLPGTIDSVRDDVGTIQGEIAKGGMTDDAKPTFSGGNATPGDTIQVIDNGEVIGSTVVDDKGNWSFTPDAPLADGKHDVVIVVVDPDGNQSEPSDSASFTVDTLAPAAATGDLIDDVGAITGPIENNGVTDDSQPEFEGKAEAGAVVIVKDNDVVIGSAAVDKNGNWSFTPSTPLAEGPHSFSTVVTDAAGNSSVPSTPINFVVDTTGGFIAIQDVTDDVEPKTGSIATNGFTNDTTPTLTGLATPDSTVNIYDNGVKIGSTTSNEQGNWTFTPAEPLNDGEHSLSAAVETKVAGESQPSEAWIINVDTVAPEAPKNFIATDDVGDVTGPIANGDTTDDNIPVFSGSGQSEGEVITVLDGGVAIGSATVNEDGSWSITPEKALSNGPHDITVTATDEAGNTSEPSAPLDFTVDTSTLPIVSGSEDFEAANRVAFHDGDTLTLSSGLEIKCVAHGLDGSSLKVATEITNKGISWIVPDFGHQAMVLVSDSSVQYSFGGPTNAVSFNVNSSNYPGNTVSYFDESGKLLHTQELPVQTGEVIDSVSWQTSGNDRIAYIQIDVGDEGASQSETGVDGLRVDDFAWGNNAVVAPQNVLMMASETHPTEITLEHIYGSDNDIQHSASVVELAGQTHLTLSLNDVLTHASENLFIDDGKAQFAVKGNESDSVTLDSKEWGHEGTTTAAGVTYDVYQSGNTELLIQHGTETHLI